MHLPASHVSHLGDSARRTPAHLPRGAVRAILASLAFASTSLALPGCEGVAADLGTVSDPGGGGDTGPVARPAVTLPLPPLKTLPFEVRLRRVADAFGLAVSDKVFDDARADRLALGAHDFANGTAPDLSWNTQRMSGWMDAMLPVCRDSRVRSSMGDWKQGGIDKFVAAAFGRPTAPTDLEDLAPALAVAGDDGWLLTCLTLVSAAEVVLQ